MLEMTYIVNLWDGVFEPNKTKEMYKEYLLIQIKP